MAGNNRIRYTLDFKANLTDTQGQLNKLKQSLREVSTISVLNPQTTPKMNEAINAAKILQVSLQKAFNTDTGKLDLTRMNLEIKNMGYSLDQLSMDLLKIGPKGQEAFLQLTTAMGNSERKVIRLNTLATKLFTTLGNTLRWQISSMALTSLYTGISTAFNYAKDLNKTLNDIRIVTGDSTEQMDRFAKSANKMAKEIDSTTLDVSKATLIYRQQGDEAELAAKKAEITTKAANVAFDVSADEMSDYLTAIWNSYQVGEDQLELFVDKLALVGAETATDMAEIATSMEKVAATANNVGVSYDQLLSTISTVSSATRMSAEQVGTAFKTIYARMGDLKLEGSVTDEDGLSVSLGQVSETLQQAGIYILDANNNLRDMGTITEEVGAKWQTMTRAEQAAIGQAMGGKRQYTQVMALFDNWDKYQETLQKSMNAQGTLNEQNEIFKESWEGALNDVKANWEKLVTSLISDDFIINILQGFSKIIDVIGEFIDAIGGFKTIIMFIGTILMRTFSSNIANGIMSLATSFSNLTGIGKKWNASLIENQLEMVKTKVQSKELSQEYGHQMSAILKLNQATEKYNTIKDKIGSVSSFQINEQIMTLKQHLEDTSQKIRSTKQEYERLVNGNNISNFTFKTNMTDMQKTKEVKKLIQALVEVDFHTSKLDKTFYNTFDEKEVQNFAHKVKSLKQETSALEQEFEIVDQRVDEVVRSINNIQPKMTVTDKFSSFASSLMNISMLITSITQVIEVFKDENATLGDKISAVFMLITTGLFTIIPLLQQAAIYGAAAFAPLYAAIGAVAAISGLIYVFDKLIVTTKEAKKNIEKLNSEIQETKDDLNSLKDEQKTANDLYEEYQELSNLKYLNKADASQLERLVEVSKELVNTYDLEYTSLDQLTGQYILAKDALVKYNKEKIIEQQEKAKELAGKYESRLANERALYGSEVEYEAEANSSLSPDSNVNTFSEEEQQKLIQWKKLVEEGGYSDRDLLDALEGGYISLLPKVEGLSEDTIKKFISGKDGQINLETDVILKPSQKSIDISKKYATSAISQLQNELIAAGVMTEENGGLALSNLLSDSVSAETWFDEEKTNELIGKAKEFATVYQKQLNVLQNDLTTGKENILNIDATISNYDDYIDILNNKIGALKLMQQEGVISEKEFSEGHKSILKEISQDTSLTMAHIKDSYNNLGNGFNNLENKLLELNNKYKSGEISLSEYNSKIGELISNTDKLKSAFGDNEDALKQFYSSLINQGLSNAQSLVDNLVNKKITQSDFYTGLEDLLTLFQNITNSIEEMGISLDDLDFDFEDAIKQVKDLKKVVKTLPDTFGETKTMSNEVKNTIAKDLEASGFKVEDFSDLVGDKSAETMSDVVNLGLQSESNYTKMQGIIAEKYAKNLGKLVTNLVKFVQDLAKKVTVDISLKMAGDQGFLENLIDLFTGGKGVTWQVSANAGVDSHRGNQDLSTFLGSSVEKFVKDNMDWGLNEKIPGPGVEKPGDKTDKFDPESTIEAKVSDLIDKYRTIPALILEALENEEDILDENIDGWEKIVENQKSQNTVREDLIENEKQLKEALDSLWQSLLDTYGDSAQEIAKWFNSEGEESEYFKKLKNATGNSDKADALQNKFDDYQAIFEARKESEENYDELLREQIEGKRQEIEKTRSFMEDEIAKIDEDIESLKDKDIVNYDLVRDLLTEKINRQTALINYLVEKGLFETDSPEIRALVQEVKDTQNLFIDTFDDEFEQDKNRLEAIYKEVEYQQKKKMEALQDEIDQRQKLINLEKKHYTTLKDLRSMQNDINKELISSKISTQWLDKETRDLLFNQSDYYEVSSKISETQEYLNDLYVKYNEEIANLGENELYLADSLTKNYEAQVAAKKEELEILKATLNIENKRNALNSALSEKNVRVFAGGQWRQVANTNDIQKAYQDLIDAQTQASEKQIEAEQNTSIREQELRNQHLTDLKNNYNEELKAMKEHIEELEHEWDILNSEFNLAGQSVHDLVNKFNIARTNLNTAIQSLNAQKNSAKQTEYGFNYSEEAIKNQMAQNSKNWFSEDAAGRAELEAQNKQYAAQIGATQDANGNWIDRNGNKITGNAKGTRNAKGGISQVNELGIELLATNGGQFIELNPHEKIFNNDQMNFLYDISRRGIEKAEKTLSSMSSYVDGSIKIGNLTLELPNVTDTDSFAKGLRGLKEYIRNTNTIK